MNKINELLESNPGDRLVSPLGESSNELVEAFLSKMHAVKKLYFTKASTKRKLIKLSGNDINTHLRVSNAQKYVAPHRCHVKYVLNRIDANFFGGVKTGSNKLMKT